MCGNGWGGNNCCLWIILIICVLCCCCGNGNSCGIGGVGNNGAGGCGC